MSQWIGLSELKGSVTVFAVDLVIGEQIVKVVSCYAPQAGGSQIEKEEFWRQNI